MFFSFYLFIYLRGVLISFTFSFSHCSSSFLLLFFSSFSVYFFNFSIFKKNIIILMIKYLSHYNCLDLPDRGGQTNQKPIKPKKLAKKIQTRKTKSRKKSIKLIRFFNKKSGPVGFSVFKPNQTKSNQFKLKKI